LYLVAENPAFIRYFLFEHTVERFANPDTFGRAKPWWFYVVLAPATSLPWSVALVTLAIRIRWVSVPQLWRNVLIFWVFLPLFFFSLSSSKLLLYVLPIFPGMALLTVYYLGRCTEAALFRWYVGIVAFFGFLLSVLCLAPAFAGVLDLPFTLRPMTAAVPAAGVVVLVITLTLWEQVRIAPRLLAAAVMFTVTLLLAAKPILRQNELAANGTRPLANMLREQNLTHRPILIYNELLPSLAFELGEIPVSLNDGNQNLNRETQFEPNQRWQQNLIYLNDSTQRPDLDWILQQRPVLIVRGELNPERHWLLPYFKQQETLGKWTVWY
jgi:4-amino-4-deoxy-L-arabinose transferase